MASNGLRVTSGFGTRTIDNEHTNMMLSRRIFYNTSDYSLRFMSLGSVGPLPPSSMCFVRPQQGDRRRSIGVNLQSPSIINAPDYALRLTHYSADWQAVNRNSIPASMYVGPFSAELLIVNGLLGSLPAGGWGMRLRDMFGQPIFHTDAKYFTVDSMFTYDVSQRIYHDFIVPPVDPARGLRYVWVSNAAVRVDPGHSLDIGVESGVAIIDDTTIAVVGCSGRTDAISPLPIPTPFMGVVLSGYIKI